MKNLLIKNSKIIIVVVNQLSLAERYFLYELKMTQISKNYIYYIIYLISKIKKIC